jgi:hypothetical protein
MHSAKWNIMEVRFDAHAIFMQSNKVNSIYGGVRLTYFDADDNIDSIV